MDDWDLLRKYAENQSESAFKALVERYAGLVYGSALRQARDAELARDIAQTVFILLARKASSFKETTILSGWLFQTTRFVTSRATRGEQRRQRREQEAVQMHDVTEENSAWRQMEPLVDDLLHELGGSDRDAVLIRYVEGLSLREVGARLGVSEEAAKKRVSRAVEKLRLLLAQRGVTLSAVLIGSALAAGMNAAVSAAIAASISSSVSLASGESVNLVTQVLDAWRWQKLKLAGVSAAAFILATSFVVRITHPAVRQANANIGASQAGPAPTTLAAASLQPAQQKNGRVLRLRAVDSVSGTPITTAPVAYMAWVEPGLPKALFDLLTDSLGFCDIPFPQGAGRLDVGVLATGWGARFATWPSEGHAGIPAEYALRLDRTTNRIGGQIVEPNGQPLANAVVWFQARGTSDYAQRERPRERFGFINAVPLQTDAEGRWNIGFVPDRNPGFSIWATHERFARTSVISVSGEETTTEPDEAVKQLRAVRLVTRMKDGSTLIGKVIDPQGRPVQGAKILRGEEEDAVQADRDGLFRVPGLPPEPWEFTVSADGFAPIRTHSDIPQQSQPLVITLQTGAVLRLHIVDENDVDVAGATVGLEQWGQNRHSLEFNEQSDFNGAIEWVSAPPGVDLELYAHKEGFCFTRDIKAKADGEVRLIRMQHSLTIHGRVVDADTGFAIRQFKAAPGYGYRYSSNPESHWFIGETVAGTNGLFVLSFKESSRPWQVRVTADGYEDWISGPLETNQLTATLDIRLKPASFVDSVKGVVLNPDGTPAAGAQVALLALNHNVRLLRKGAFSGDKRWLTTSDASGAFHFPVNRSAHSVAAVSADGYAHIRITNFAESATLQIEPWGAVSGIIDAAAKTYPAESMELYDPTADNYQGRVSLLGSYTTKPDAEGRFSFDKVPPGEFSVFINSLRGLSYHHQTPLKVTPGETTQVTIVEKPGVLLKGRVTAASADIDWIKDRVVVRVERESLRHAPGWNSRNDDKLEAVDYWTSPVAREFSTSRRMTDLDVRADGSFVSVERVPAGDYLLFAVFKNASTNRKITITPQQEILAELDLGAIELRGR
jgi:RNA polymerase sigma factor (sigma-70 family)